MQKMFVSLKNNCMFAVSYINAGSGLTASNDSGFFISDCNHIGYSTPSLMLNGSTAPCECRTEGKAMPFFYSLLCKHFYSIMSYIDNNVLATNNSTCQNTPYGAKSVSTDAKRCVSTQQGEKNTSQSQQANNNVHCKITQIQKIQPFSAEKLRKALKSVLSEFIDKGFIDLKNSKL